MTRRTFVICLGYVVLLSTLAVGADRVIAHRVFEDPGELVPAYRSFQEPAVGAKLHDLEKTPGTLSTLFVGNSRTLFGVQPETFDRALAQHGITQRSFNLAMPTVDVRFWPPFFEEFYERSAPEHLLLGVIPRDLDARNVIGAAELQAFTSSPGFENRDRSEIWRSAEERMSQLFRLRGRFNEVRRFVRTRERLEPAQIRVSGRGWGQFAPGLAPSDRVLEEKARQLAVRSSTFALQTGAEQIRAMGRLDRWVRARGGCLTLITTPLLYDREPWGTVEVRRDFERTMRAFIRDNPHVRFLDLGPRVEKSYALTDFGDGDHLDPSGARRFSRELADAVAEQGEGC